MLRTTLLMVGAAAVVSAQVSFGLFASWHVEGALQCFGSKRSLRGEKDT
jgi:hypothetical protein